MKKRCGMLIFLCVMVIPGCVASTVSQSYDVKTVKTIHGVIRQMETVVNEKTNEPGMHLKVGSPDGTYTVHLCPDWYAQKLGLRFAIGDGVTVTGSAFFRHNEKNMYASRIVDKNGSARDLRDMNTGAPLWRGRERVDGSAKGLKEEEMRKKYQKGDGTIGGGKGHEGPRGRQSNQ